MHMGAFSILERGYVSLATFNPPLKSYIPRFALGLLYAYCEISVYKHSLNIFHHLSNCLMEVTNSLIIPRNPVLSAIMALPFLTAKRSTWKAPYMPNYCPSLKHTARYILPGQSVVISGVKLSTFRNYSAIYIYIYISLITFLVYT